MEAEAFKAGLREAKDGLKDFGDETQRTAATAKDAGERTARSAEESGKKVAESAKSTGAAMKDLGVGLSQTMTAGFALYKSFDDIEKKQYALEKATLASTKADEAARKAKEDYDAAVARYGEHSDQAAEALFKLNVATDAAALADQRAEMAQGNLNQQMVQTGLTLIPAVITGIDGMVKGWKALKDLNVMDHLKGMKDAIGGLGSDKLGPLASLGAGIGAVAFMMGAFNAKSDEMRIMYSVLAGAMVAAAAAQWILNAATAFGLSLTGAGAILVGVAAAAAAGVYLLSTQYGAPASETTGERIRAEAESYGQTATAPSGGGGGGGEASEPYVTYWGETVGGGGGRGAYTGRWAKTLDWKPADDAEKRRILMNGGMNDYETSWVMRYRGFVIDFHDNWQDPADMPENAIRYGPFAYSAGGWALSPQIALLAEAGPELVLNERQVDALGGPRTIIFNIYGGSTQEIMDQLASKFREEGINY